MNDLHAARWCWYSWPMVSLVISAKLEASEHGFLFLIHVIFQHYCIGLVIQVPWDQIWMVRKGWDQLRLIIVDYSFRHHVAQISSEVLSKLSLRPLCGGIFQLSLVEIGITYYCYVELPVMELEAYEAGQLGSILWLKNMSSLVNRVVGIFCMAPLSNCSGE